jgi:hypothetical protein
MEAGNKESQVTKKLSVQLKTCALLSDSIHLLFERLKNITREVPNVKSTETFNDQQLPPQELLVPLAIGIENNTDILIALKEEVDSFINRLEN